MSDMMKATVHDAVRCLDHGGRAWDPDGRELRSDGATYVYDNDDPVCLSSFTLGPGWRIEPRDEYFDVAPTLVGDDWRVFVNEASSISLDGIVSHKDFLGYVFDGDPCLYNSSIMWLDTDGDHDLFKSEGSTMVRCSAVRFKTINPGE